MEGVTAWTAPSCTGAPATATDNVARFSKFVQEFGRREGYSPRAQRLAEDMLKQGMFREQGNWTLAAAELMNVEARPSHGQMISWKDALSPKLGLTVEHMDPADPVWQGYWHLYCLQRLAINDREKIFESDFASLTMEGVAA